MEIFSKIWGYCTVWTFCYNNEWDKKERIICLQFNHIHRSVLFNKGTFRTDDQCSVRNETNI